MLPAITPDNKTKRTVFQIIAIIPPVLPPSDVVVNRYSKLIFNPLLGFPPLNNPLTVK